MTFRQQVIFVLHLYLKLVEQPLELVSPFTYVIPRVLANDHNSRVFTTGCRQDIRQIAQGPGFRTLAIQLQKHGSALRQAREDVRHIDTCDGVGRVRRHLGKI